MAKLQDLTGQVFGRLTVLERAENIDNKVAWLCRCDCGREVVVKGCNLKNTTRMCSECKADLHKVHKHSSRFIDLTNMRFGRLVVQYENGFDKYGKTVWHCKCDCGNECDVKHGQLVQNKTKSCGCLIHNQPVRDLTGEIFGRLHVLHRANDKYIGNNTKRIMWHCVCDCGNELDVYTGDLRTGNTKSCGCSRKESGRFQDLTGMKFNMLTVLYRAPNNGKVTMWHCKCDCGCEKDVSAVDLTRGHVKSCGCLQHISYNFEDLTGATFNHWHVIGFAGVDNGKTMWTCQCDCGQIRKVWAASLKNGASQSCGCMSLSRLEQWVLQYLQVNGYRNYIDYEQQKKFDGDGLCGFSNVDGKIVAGRPLSYDFYIHTGQLTFLIECQGRQHYASIEYFGGDTQFEKQKMYDLLKRQFARWKNISLLEIPYTADTYEKVAEILQQAGI